MQAKEILADERLKTPRAAAVAGIVFSVLFLISLVLIRTTVPGDLKDAASWLGRGASLISLPNRPVMPPAGKRTVPEFHP
jgi:hypothetical protein